MKNQTAKLQQTRLTIFRAKNKETPCESGCGTRSYDRHVVNNNNNKIHKTRADVLTNHIISVMNIAVFLDVKPRDLVEIARSFGRACFFQLHPDQDSSRFLLKVGTFIMH
jgi:hypothetical protein